MAYFIKRIQTGARTLRKSGHQTFRKSGHYTKNRCMILKINLDKFDGADFKDDNIIFRFHPKHTQIKHFWPKLSAYLFFSKVLLLDKFKGADFKYDNITFNIQPKTTKKIPKFRHFCFFFTKFWN